MTVTIQSSLLVGDFDKYVDGYNLKNEVSRLKTPQISICQVFEKTLFASKNQNQHIISNFQQKNIHPLLSGHGTNLSVS